MRDRIYAYIAVLAMLTACQSAPQDAPADTSASSVQTTAGAQDNEDHPTITAPTVTSDGTESSSDKTGTDASEEELTKNAAVILSDSGITIDGSGAEINGSVLIVKKGGSYDIQGSMMGQIVVDAGKDDKVELVLDGVDITSSGDSAAILVKSADKVSVKLKKGSVNSLSDGGASESVIYSDEDLTVKGSGALTVTGGSKCALWSKNDIKIKNGTVTVSTDGDGIKGRDSVTIGGGSDAPVIDITCGGDGIVSDSKDDGKGTVTVTDGTVGIKAGGGAAASSKVHDEGWGRFDRSDETDTVSSKGIKAAASVTISGGTIDIDTADDSIHSDGDVTISGGTLTIASGDDALHADGTLALSGGSGDITKSYEGMEGAVILVSGGDWSVHADDDGINAGDGTGDIMGMFGGNFGGGTPPDFGDMPEFNGERPDFGDMPNYDGERPDFGDMPNFDGERPDFGDMPNFGEMPGSVGTSDKEVYIQISGGSLYVYADGDGLDSNGDITMSGGTVTVDGPTGDMNGTIDYAGSFSVTGGTLYAAGSAGMAQGFTTVTGQSAVSVLFTTQQKAGTKIALTTSDGTTVVEYAPAKEFKFMALTSPQITDGTYVLTADGEKLCDITVSGNTCVNDKGETVEGGFTGFGGFGGPGGFGGGRPF